MSTIQKIRNFLSHTRGAIAVETALITPIIVAALLAAADLGIAVNQKQRLNAAQRTGAMYYFNGGRETLKARNIVRAAFRGTHKPYVWTWANCACLNEDALNENFTQDIKEEQEDAYKMKYTRLSEGDMCPGVCPDGSPERTILTMHIYYKTNGIFRDYTFRDQIRVRIE